MADYKIGLCGHGRAARDRRQGDRGDFRRAAHRGFLDACDPCRCTCSLLHGAGRGQPAATRGRAPSRCHAGRGHVGDGQLRPRPRHVYWGTGSTNRHHYGNDRRGSNLYRVAHRHRRCHWQVAVASPVHAPRHPRLGFQPRAGAGRGADRRPDATGGDGGQSEWLLLCSTARLAGCSWASLSATPPGPASWTPTAIPSSSTTAARAACPIVGSTNYMPPSYDAGAAVLRDGAGRARNTGR